MRLLVDHDYHVVELNRYGMNTEVYDWMLSTFGDGDGQRWFYRHPKIYFTDAKDHMMFLIKWS
jgi:hypothetical protein